MKTSVCMAVYNGAPFLEDTLNSILSQIELTDEIIIIDDASTDHSNKIIQSIPDQRIKLFTSKKNNGVNHSFFEAISKATGDLIFISDQDDKWNNNKVKKSKKVFIEKKIDVLVHNANIIMNGKKINKSLFEINNSGRGFFKNLWSDKYVGCCMVISKDGLKKLLPKKKIEEVYYDHFLGLSAELKKLNILFYEEKLIDYNRHSETHTDIFQRRNLYRIFKDRIKLVWMLIINY